MRHIPVLLLSLAVLAMLYILPGAAAQESPIQVTVDRTTLSTDDTLNLQITVTSSDGSSVPQPVLPPLEGFNTVGQSTSSQFSLMNGAMSASIVLNYTLQPTKAGNLTIGAVTLTLNGKTYSSDPISIRVTQGSGSPSSPSQSQSPAQVSPNVRGSRFFVEGVVDNKSPYIGEQVIYSFRFYQSENLFDQPSYDAPNFTGFWSNGKPDQKQSYQDIDGISYRVTELKTILFPTLAGAITIGPATLTIPGSFFDQGVTLQTDPVRLDVKPLPGGAPDGFAGAVGQFTLKATVDSSQGTVNEPLTLHLSLEGMGNIENLPDPALPQIANLRAFNSTSTAKTTINDGKLGGSKLYEQILVPTKEGSVTIPAITYAYFDPASKNYKTISTQPIPLSIGQGTVDSQPAQPSAAGGTIAGKQSVQAVATDIRYIKSVPNRLTSAQAPFTRSAFYWLLWGVPALMLSGYGIWAQRQRRLRQNMGSLRSLMARKNAIKALARARKSAGDPYNAVGEILQVYLSEKAQQPVRGLTQAALLELLRAKGLSESAAHRVSDYMLALEAGRFGSNGSPIGDSRSIYGQFEQLISVLDKEFTR